MQDNNVLFYILLFLHVIIFVQPLLINVDLLQSHHSEAVL